jgi:hypothetical protein
LTSQHNLSMQRLGEWANQARECVRVCRLCSAQQIPGLAGDPIGGRSNGGGGKEGGGARALGIGLKQTEQFVAQTERTDGITPIASGDQAQRGKPFEERR